MDRQFLVNGGVRPVGHNPILMPTGSAPVRNWEEVKAKAFAPPPKPMRSMTRAERREADRQERKERENV